MNKPILLLFSLLFSATLQAASPSKTLSVTFTGKETIRQLAQKHLHNPDLWADILHANQLQAVHELKPGTALKIPVSLILNVDKGFKQSQKTIHQAAALGAKILAKKAFNCAIDQQNLAVDARQAGLWQKSLNHINAADKEAKQALSETQKKRNEPVQAVLESLDGDVQQRKINTFYWKKAIPKQVLDEQEKLRTLNASHALIRFRDDSKLHLSENTQIVIQKMRQDRLSKQDNTGVLLNKGDLHALLGGTPNHKQFNLEVKGVRTEIKSKDFWIDKRGKTARFANYEGEIALSSGGHTVRLKSNQGAVVKENQQPSAIKELLPAPLLSEPANYATLYASKRSKQGLSFSWKEQPEARNYWLEIAKDQGFEHLILDKKNLRSTYFILPFPDNGLYYWRVASIDSDSLPSPKSKVRLFKMLHDEQPPYLVIQQPADKVIVRQDSITVSGKTEQQVELRFNNKLLAYAEDGQFQLQLALQEGDNQITLTAIDPAGNQTELSRSISYLPDQKQAIQYDSQLTHRPDTDVVHLLTNRDLFTLRGHTAPNLKIELKTEQGKNFKTISDKQGAFQLNLPLQEGVQAFTVYLTQNSGFQNQKRLLIERDQQPPEITLQPLPSSTRQAQLLIEGEVQDATQLHINAKAVVLQTGRFKHTLHLQQGNNALQLTAKDLAGNSRLWQKNIILDQNPPQLLKHHFSKKYVKGGDVVQLHVQVKDDSGMKSGATYQVRVGKQLLSGYVRLCPDKTCYQGKVVVPLHNQGRIKLESLQLEDYLGNRKNYRFN
ncbi:FecR domain-containing protein [Candidatus Venteria ishoeyi]|uniref:Bacillopeptidase F n=1 Tax=Candidatus Venteria ishoeyi TaxID=1899563 RepID=A0A1H6FFK5_9GAMM|nr:FecR domain-containing protein [Candidatus Venteria ishoeyi]MDM8545574.1 FecR domain-containing protein [Candidatus Venteria ishoeyi]SEH08850.1 Bacillopeptidase F precursor [Candidatus Venteria ishoeyi]